MKQTVAVLIRNTKGLILGVSRKDNPKDFGLPGGKLDLDEDFVDAAIRETCEETGLIISDLTQVFARQDSEYHVVTFIPATVHGVIKTIEAGVVDWITEEELLAGSFGEYNKELLKKVKELNV